ncbi:MAG TPA: hypothetical protein DE036_01995 [Actinobacteria bacterium]|nr:hypothetical protein [Actinomycetota bacterium]
MVRLVPVSVLASETTQLAVVLPEVSVASALSTSRPAVEVSMVGGFAKLTPSLSIVMLISLPASIVAVSGSVSLISPAGWLSLPMSTSFLPMTSAVTAGAARVAFTTVSLVTPLPEPPSDISTETVVSVVSATS